MNSSTAGNLYALEKRAVKFGKVTDINTRSALSRGLHDCKGMQAHTVHGGKTATLLCLSLPAHLEWVRSPMQLQPPETKSWSLYTHRQHEHAHEGHRQRSRCVCHHCL